MPAGRWRYRLSLVPFSLAHRAAEGPGTCSPGFPFGPGASGHRNGGPVNPPPKPDPNLSPARAAASARTLTLPARSARRGGWGRALRARRLPRPGRHGDVGGASLPTTTIRARATRHASGIHSADRRRPDAFTTRISDLSPKFIKKGMEAIRGSKQSAGGSEEKKAGAIR